MHAAFITLADHSFVGAARQGLAARNDSEDVLKLDPNYQDAKMAVGIQQFAVASLPRGTIKTLPGAAKEPAPHSVPVGERPYAHPYYWSAFVLIGDPD